MKGALVELDRFGWRPFGRRAPVFDHLSFVVQPGERVLVAGPSGSGKSTLLHAVAGALTTAGAGYSTGRVLVDDVDASLAPSGLLVQDPHDARVAARAGRDVAFGLENLGVARDAMAQRVASALESVRFPYRPEHPVTALSGGESQRLALAGVLVLGPGLVLLDEPTSMLDSAAATAVRQAIVEAVARSGATMLLVEHDLEVWLPFVDRALVLGADGALVADGPAAEVMHDRAEDLASRGVWIPGTSGPEPGSIPVPWLAPAASVAVGSVVLRARGAGVRRSDALRWDAAPTLPSTRPDALADVDLDIRAGEILAIVGPSGAGKSTLTAVLAGLERPTSGTVAADHALWPGTKGLTDPESQPGRWESRALARRIGWVPQRPELSVVGRTVRDDVLATGRALDLPRGALESRADGLIEALGLAPHALADPHHLSGGESRRLALASAVAHGPTVLVLDEPTVGQDRLTWSAVAGVIVGARGAGVAVVVATHDRHLIALADRVIRLEAGRLRPEVAASTSPSPDEPSPDEPSAGAKGRGLAAACGPLSLVAASLLLLVGSLFISTVFQAVLGVAALAIAAPIAIGRSRPRVRLLVPGLVAVASVGLSSWYLSAGQNPATGLVAGLRIAFFVFAGVYLARQIEPSAFGDHLAQRLRMPARPVVAATASLQQLDGLAEQWGHLRASRRIRGLDGHRSPVARGRHVAGLTFALLASSIRTAARMSVAMDARGFSSLSARGVRRTWAEAAPWRSADSALVALAVVVAAVPAVAGLLGA